MGETPHSARKAVGPNLTVMRFKQEKKKMVFGAFIAAVYDAWPKNVAKGFVRLAVNARLIEFQGQQRVVIS